MYHQALLYSDRVEEHQRNSVTRNNNMHSRNAHMNPSGPFLGIHQSGHARSSGSSVLKQNRQVEKNQEDTRCPICLEDFNCERPAVCLSKCNHKFCRECKDEAMKRKPVCPVCGVIYGVMRGNQPDGTMTVTESAYPSLPGYEGCGIITINYIFPSGIQGPNHPNPGVRYSGTHRTAFLPNNAEGKRVASLLRKAFDARLTFTVGTSVTTGARNAVTWNDIHHKTSMNGGAQWFGYPDPTYLRRVTEELAAQGIK